MKYMIYLDSIGLDNRTCCIKITFTLDSLNFSKQSGYKFSQFYIIMNLQERLSVTFYKFKNMILLTFLKAPVSNQSSVTHMSFFDLTTRLYTYQLSHKTIHHICIILRLVCFTIRNKTKLDQFVIRNIIQSKKICTCLLYCVTIGLEIVWINP